MVIMPNRSNLVGRVFSKWFVVDYAGKSKNGGIKYLCRCECGAENEIVGAELTRGRTGSCKPCSKKKHGDCNTALHRVWGSMVQRCVNPKNKAYMNYGGRGITICKEWREDYRMFRDWSLSNGYIHGLMIDRVDNDKGYSPDNCTFSTRLVQNNNRRNCRFIEIFGVRLTIAQQAARFGINKGTLRDRINIGLLGKELLKGIPAGIMEIEGDHPYMATCRRMSCEFKTRRGAAGWLRRRGFDEEGNRL
jgi:hypothetical protein